MNFAPCLLQTPPLTTNFSLVSLIIAHPSLLHRLTFAPCLKELARAHTFLPFFCMFFAPISREYHLCASNFLGSRPSLFVRHLPLRRQPACMCILLLFFDALSTGQEQQRHSELKSRSKNENLQRIIESVTQLESEQMVFLKLGCTIFA